jgi:hypothetical protein
MQVGLSLPTCDRIRAGVRFVNGTPRVGVNTTRHSPRRCRTHSSHRCSQKSELLALALGTLGGAAEAARKA